jgi:hypothetical protein
MASFVLFYHNCQSTPKGLYWISWIGFTVALFSCAGKATILELETTTSLRESGEILCMNRSLRCPYYFTDHHNLQKSSAVILLCNAGVLSTCVVLEGFQTLHSHILMLLILLIKFIAFLFQIRHLLQYMTTKQSNLRHVTLFTCAVLQ